MPAQLQTTKRNSVVQQNIKILVCHDLLIQAFSIVVIISAYIKPHTETAHAGDLLTASWVKQEAQWLATKSV